MDKVTSLNAWNLSAVADAQRMVTVSVFVPYPKVTTELMQLAPKERQAWITQKMRDALEEVLAHNMLINYKTIKSLGHGERSHGARGEISLANLQKLAALEAVESISIESTNECPRKLAKPRRRTSFYCVKMTVAIQIEGYERGMQTYEERYVLFRARSEAEALRKAEAVSAEYGKPYLNSEGLVVRWKTESLDNVYEVVPAGERGNRNLDGAEVFSIFKSRKITPERAWPKAE